MGADRSKSASDAPTSWTWPHPPLTDRYNATVTEIMDLASDGRRVAVIEGAIWPAIGGELSVFEDDAHVRRGTVSRVELVLGFRKPARVVVWAALERDPA
jgi:hypothetical protein